MPREFPEIDFDHFHRQELPGRIARGNGRHAYAACRQLGSFAFRTTAGGSFTYLPRHNDIELLPGEEEAETVVEIEASDFSALVNDLASGPGLFYPNRIQIVRGSPAQYFGWECGWRALYHGQRLFDPARVDLRDTGGAPLDPARSFGLDDDRQDMAHFLAEAGFIHVRSVFSPDELKRFREAALAAHAAAREGDGNSWWGVTDEGKKVLTRVLDGSDRPGLQSLERDPRLTGLIDLVDAELEADNDSGEAVNILFKEKGLVEGLGNLPWHRDCSMGGHAIRCPTINLSVFLSPANPETGGLWMLPGSAQYSFSPSVFDEQDIDGAISVDAAAGDVTLHFGDMLHAAHPPRGDGPLRQSLILTWRPPDSRPHDGQQHYNDALKGDDGVPLAGRRGS